MNKHLTIKLKKKNYQLTLYLYQWTTSKTYPSPLLFGINIRSRAVLNLLLS